MSKFYTNEMKIFILNNYKKISTKQLQKEFNDKFNVNITHTAIQSYLKRNKLKVGYKNKRKFKDEHIKYLEANVEGTTLKELTDKFNKKFKMNVNERTISNLKNRYNLKSGIAGGQFEKGWKPKHRVLWENANGPIPQKHTLIFADRNKRNIKLDNLILVSDAQLSIMSKNKLFKDDEELTKAGATVAKILDKINKIKKEVR